MNVGLMGGSFDPVHHGHLMAAQDAIEQAGLDRLIMIPAARTPRKAGRPPTSGHHRVAMLHAALAGESRCEVSDFELSQGGVSYTIHTVRHFRERFPDDRLFWIIGADQVPSLDQWRAIEEIAKTVEFIALERPGHPIVNQPTTPGLTLHRCTGNPVAIGSTALRARLEQGQSVESFIPPAVIVYIGQHELYR